MLAAVTEPVALIKPAVITLPPITLAVALTKPAVSMLAPCTLPLMATFPTVLETPVALAVTTAFPEKDS